MPKLTKKIKPCKFVKVNKDFIYKLEDLIIKNSNSCLIGVEIYRECKRFMKEIENIPLSEELQ